MILLGGMDAGLLAVSAVAAVLLALGFLGPRPRPDRGLLGSGEGRAPPPLGAGPRSSTGAAAAALLALTIAA